jgi:hypothetical protein
MELGRMSKEQLEDFLDVELRQIGTNIYSTTDGKFSVKHMNYISIEGVPEPESWWSPGWKIEVVTKNFFSSEAAQKWIAQSYKLYEHVEGFLKRNGNKSREETVIRRRLERMR